MPLHLLWQVSSRRQEVFVEHTVQRTVNTRPKSAWDNSSQRSTLSLSATEPGDAVVIPVLACCETSLSIWVGCRRHLLRVLPLCTLQHRQTLEFRPLAVWLHTTAQEVLSRRASGGISSTVKQQGSHDDVSFDDDSSFEATSSRETLQQPSSGGWIRNNSERNARQVCPNFSIA